MIASTLPLSQCTARTWPVVVVGAGVAGALAARQLAQAGIEVLLVDRAPFPRWKVCGCCLNRRALETLAAVGLGSLVGDRGGIPLYSLRLASGGKTATVPLPLGAALSREQLDATLVQEAIQAGAQFLAGTQASSRGLVGEQMRQILLHQGEQEATIQTRVLLAADGLQGQLLAREPGCEVVVRRGARIGAGAVGDEAPPFFTPGTIFMACGAEGYVGLVRLEDGRLDLAAALDAEQVRLQGSIANTVARLLGQVGWTAHLDLSALTWRGTPPLTRRARLLAGPGLFVLGDAAGYVEPFTGEGMAWALASAVAITPLVLQAMDRWHPGIAHAWQRRYQDLLGGAQRRCRFVTGLLRSSWMRPLLVHVLAHVPSLARPFVP